MLLPPVLLAAAAILVPPASSQVSPASSSSGSFATVARSAVPAGPPNVVLILLDDVGFGDLGVYGSTFVQTPTLDRLASEGVRLTSFVTSGVVCSPTRASVLTGNQPIEVGFYNALFDDSQRGLAAAESTLVEVLRDAGYATGYVGKWHLGYATGVATDEFLPPAAGFESSARLLLTQPPNHFDPTFEIDEATSVQSSGYDSTLITDYALAFLDEHAGSTEPFFLDIGYYAPHLPAQAPQAYLDLYPNPGTWSTYAAMLTHCDAEIDRLLQHIDALGMRENTLVLVFSDNGGADAAGLHPNGNGGLAGFKREVLEGGIRTPFLARFPGRIAAGTTNDTLVASIDVLPTVLALAGVPNPLSGLSGRDMSAALTGTATLPRTDRLFWSARGGLASFAPPSGIVDSFAVREDRSTLGELDWKLVFEADQTLSLFDLDSDPGETTDRAAEFPAVRDELWDAYWTYHAPACEIDWIGQPAGSVTPLADGFDFAGGSVTLPPQAPFDSHDGDFTLRLSALPASPGGSEQVLATKPGSWELALDAAGLVRLALFGQDGTTTTLVSTTAPAAGTPLSLAFTLTAWPLTPLDAVLFVDGVAEATTTLGPLAPNRNPIALGNDDQGLRPWFGSLTDVHFHTSALIAEELLGVVPAQP